MSATKRRAVITGVGLLSPIGCDLNTVWDSLREGRSGVRTIRTFDTSGLPVHFAGEIADFDAKKYIPKEHRKALRMMARTVQLGVGVASLTLADSGVDRGKLDPTRFGVEYGSGLIASELPELADAAKCSANCKPGVVDLAKWGELSIPAIQPLWMLKYLPNMPASHVSMMYDAQGPNNTITESDVAGLLALGEAYRILERDQADFFLVGGAESKLNPLSLVRQCLFEPMSKRNDAPEKACRPFDRGRDGLVIGEGAALLSLEELSHAEKRGAKIYAELVGFGAAFDRRRDGSGIARAVQAALAEAGVTPDQVDHINAHGLSTVECDAREAKAVRAVFGDGPNVPPVFAAKSYLGNLGAAGPIAELAADLLALQHGVTPATLNYEEADPECPVNLIVGQPRPVAKPYIVKISFTHPGQSAAAVLRRWTEK